VIANGDYCADTNFVGVSDDASLQSARECLEKLRQRFAPNFRASVLALKETEYVRAARALGAGGPALVLRHILPNVLPTLCVYATLFMANAVLVEAALSFLGLGVQPPTPSWGLMVSTGRDVLLVAPHVATMPGLAIVVSVLGFNLLGDGLRDALDPRLRGA